MPWRKRTCASLLAGAVVAGAVLGGPAAGAPDRPDPRNGPTSSGEPAEVAIGHPDSWFVTSGESAPALTAEATRHRVEVSLLNRAGAPALGEFDSVRFLDLASREWTETRHGEVVDLPAGEYHVFALALTPRPDQREPSVTMLVRHGFQVRADTSLSLDARTAQPAGSRLDRADARYTHLTAGGSFVDEAANERVDFSITMPENYDALYLDGFQEEVPGFLFYLRERLITTNARLAAARPDQFQVPVWWAPDSPVIDGTVSAGLVDAGAGEGSDLAGADLDGKVVLVTPRDGYDYGEAARVVAERGGRALLLRIRPDVGAHQGTEDATAVPVLYTTRAVADRLPATTRVRLTGVPDSPYVYELAVPLDGTDDASPRVRDRDLARVDAHYPQPAPPVEYAYTYPSSRIGPHRMFVGGSCCEPIGLPHRRTEYYSPGAVWSGEYNASASGGAEEYEVHHLSGQPRELAPGQRLTEVWGAPVLGPAVAGTYGSNPEIPTRWAYRDGETVEVAVPLLADGDGHVSWSEIDQIEAATGATALYHDGELVGESDQAGNGVFTVPTGPAGLRLVTEFHRPDRSRWPTSVSVMADWTVRSSGDGVLPLLAVRYRPEADPTGAVPTGSALPLWVERHAGAPDADIVELTVDVSYDDGASWDAATLRRGGEGWTASLPSGQREGFVSLRARAVDEDGNSVVQTIIRAYRIVRGA